MADDMEEVTQRFTAETEEYVAEVEAAARDARDFADANTEAKLAVDGMRDSSATAALSADELRDRLAEVAGAAGLYRDELGKLRDSQGKFFAESALMDMALGHTRDEALEAAAAMRELKSQDKSMAKDGLLSSLFMMLEGNGGQGLTSGLPMTGLLGLPALIAIVPAIEAALVLVTGVVSGFAAAGAGAGAFALLALPAIKAVSGAYTQITADQQAYNRATTAAAKSTALKHLKADYAALDPYERQALAGVQTLAGEYKKLSTAFEPSAFKVFAGVLKVANELLPDVTPFATTFANAISGLLGHLGTFAGSSGFKDWLKQFQALEGPSVTAIGDGIGQVAGSIGKLLTTMSTKDVVNAINIAFGILSGTIGVVAYMVKRLMTNWDEISGAFRRVRHDVAADAHEVAHVFDDLRHDIANDAHNIASYFDEARANVHRWADDVQHDFDVVRHDVATAGDDIARPFEKAADQIRSNWHNILVWLTDPVAAAVFEIRTHTHQIAQDFDTMRHDAASILDGWRHDAAAAFDGVAADALRFADWLPHAIGDAFTSARHSSDASSDGMRHDISRAFDGIRHDIAAALDEARHVIAQWAGNALGYFARLPGQVNHALAALPGMLYGAGVQAIRSLISGAGSMIGSAESTLKSWGHDLANAVVNPFGIHFSEPSEAAQMIKAGVNAARGLAAGMLSEVGSVRQAAAAIQSAAGLSAGGTYAGAALAGGGYGASGGGPPSVHLTMPVTLQGAAQAYNTPAFYQYLMNVVQEAILRYQLNNPGTGLASSGRL